MTKNKGVGGVFKNADGNQFYYVIKKQNLKLLKDTDLENKSLSLSFFKQKMIEPGAIACFDLVE